MELALVAEAREYAAQVGLPDPTSVLLDAETVGDAIKVAARADMWESVMASRWVNIPLEGGAYSPEYIYYTEMSSYRQKLFLAFRLGCLNFKRRYPGKYNNVECIWKGCQEDDTYSHSLVCPFNKVKKPRNEEVFEVTEYLDQLSKVRQQVIGEPLAPF